ISVAMLSPVWLFFWITKGTAYPDTGEIKLLTAKNWGYFHTAVPGYLYAVGPWLAFVGIATFRLKSWPVSVRVIFLFSASMTTLYSITSLPRSPWYYLPFHLGIYTLVGFGLSLAARALVTRHW